jgi:hypothetical protein
MREVPRKKQKPVVDLLVSGQKPQSESEKPLRDKYDEELKSKEQSLSRIIFKKFKNMYPKLSCGQ